MIIWLFVYVIIFSRVMSYIHLRGMSVVNDECRLRRNVHFAAADNAESALVDNAVAADNCVAAFRNGYGACLLGRVEHHDDVLPCVASGIVFQAEGHEIVLHGHELKMTAHLVGRAERNAG